MRNLETLTFDEVQRIVEGPAFLPEYPVPRQRVSLPAEALPALPQVEDQGDN